MKVLQIPVQTIEQATELIQVSSSVAVLLKSLKHVYENSNFYKEARIVSFIDRLLVCVQNKIKTQCSIGLALLHGS